MLSEILLPEELELQVANAGDETFMERLFGSTREYLYLMNLPRQAVDILIAQQYQLQLASYRSHWPDAVIVIIQRSGVAIGKMIIDEQDASVRIVDLALLPQWRGKGYGKILLRALQVAVKKRQSLLTLSVEQHNLLAKKLYLSLGFTVTESSTTHESMCWLPNSTQPS